MMGQLCQRRREFERAHQCHAEARALQQQLDLRSELPVTLNFMGLLARHAGRLDEARRLGRESLARREELGHEYEIGLSLIDLGATELALGNQAQAGALWQRALDIFDRAGTRYEQAQLHFYLAVLAQQQGDEPGRAAHLAQTEALACAYRHDDPPRRLNLFVEETTWTAPLLAEALRQGQPSACVDCLLPRLGPAAAVALRPLLSAPQPPVRARAARLLGQLGDATALQSLHACRHDPDPDARRAVEEAIAAILDTPPLALRIHCLGRFRLWRGEVEITRWERTAARDVLVYLLAHRPRPAPMDQLMDIFWPDSGPAQARKSLHQAIAALHRALEPELAGGMPSRYLRVGDNSYALNLPPGSWVDYEQFEARLSPLLVGPADIQVLTEALALYQGDYLPESLYEDWTVPMRERLRGLYLTGLRRLAAQRLETDQAAAAVETAARLLEHDPWDEDAVLLLMQAHAAQGYLTAALRAYETLRDRLRRDLDLPPRDDLTALYRRLRQR